MHYDELNISKEWFKIGNDKIGNNAADIAFRFIAYWIAFNSFYSKYSLMKNERDQITNYISKNYDSYFNNIIDFETDPEMEIFKKLPVLSGTYRPRRDCVKSNKYSVLFNDLNNPTLPEEKRMEALFLTIYQVRCNMFHGSKTPEPERDYQLVDSSQKILEKVLRKLIEKTSR